MYHTFVTFDISNENSKYDKFYDEAKKIGLTRYIPAECITSKKTTDLPSTTLFGVYSGEPEIIRDNLRNKINNIYKILNIKGNFIVIVSQTWGKN